MTYVRKTRDEFTLLGDYGYGDGLEELSTYGTRAYVRRLAIKKHRVPLNRD